MKTGLFSKSIWLWAGFGLLMIVGAGIRFFHLYDQPLDINPTRQLHSAVIARGMYYQNLESAEPWKRDMAVQRWQQEGLIEPQFLEAITAATYRLAGKEIMWVGRLYSILFWLAGGAALFLLLLEMTGTAGALTGLAYFLVLPFGVMASRVFQPDPLMVALIAFALLASVRWRSNPTWGNAITAGLLGGAAILCKSVAVFFIGGAWLGLILSGGNLRKMGADRQVWGIAVITILPSVLFYIYGIYINGQLASQFDLRFFPSLWISPVFYLQWVGQIGSTTGFEWFIVALFSLFLVRDYRLRWMMLGMWVGYVIYGMTFSFHITTHDYYQLPLILLVACGLAAGAQTLLDRVQEPKKLTYAVIAFVMIFTVVIKGWNAIITLKQLDYSSEVWFWEKLGKSLGREKTIVGLTQDYGYRLYLYGWVDSANWMRTNDINYRELGGQRFDTQKLFAQQVKDKDLFVVTMPDELDKQSELKSILYKTYPYKEILGGTLVFDLKNPIIK